MADEGNSAEADGARRHLEVIREEYSVAGHFQQGVSPSERSRAFAILFVSLLCMGAGQSVIYTILPPVGTELGLGPVQVTSIFAVSAAIWVFSSSFWGVRSDRWGRKPVMLLGLIAFAVSFAAFAVTMLGGLHKWIAPALIFPMMIASRCIYGTFGSGTSAAAQAYVADRTTPRERLSGVATISMAFALGTIFGPVVGSRLARFGMMTPFLFVSAIALLSALAIFFHLPERTPPLMHRKSGTTLRWYQPRMLPFVLFGVLLSLIGSIPIQTIGFYFMTVLHQSKHATADSAGWGLLLQAIAALFAQFVVVQRSGLSARTLTTLGLCVAALSNLLFVVARHPEFVYLALICSGLGFGMARPGFTSGASLSVEPHEQGAVAGLLNAAGAAGFIFGPLIGWMFGLAPVVPYVFGVVTMLCLLAALYLSPTLRNAGDIPPEPEIVEETAEAPMQNA
jgi:MFS family permease